MLHLRRTAFVPAGVQPAAALLPRSPKRHRGPVAVSEPTAEELELTRRRAATKAAAAARRAAAEAAAEVPLDPLLYYYRIMGDCT